ncbi:MAG: DUF2156 domain-containing protein [Candidatus Paceibacteria bacterium]
MIPEFPKFKKLELSDRKTIERFTAKFPPYSDFNFVSMWSWDTKGEMSASILNNNLVIKFTDYLNGEPFFSFLGDNQIAETTQTLLDFSRDLHAVDELRLVPEAVVADCVHSFQVVPDEDAFDYVYEVEHLANMDKWSKHTSGKKVRRFLKEGLPYEVRVSNIKEAPFSDCLKLFKKWAEVRSMDPDELSEFTAAERIFNSDIDSLRVVTLYIEGKLVGFTVFEVISDEYAVSHFAKADKDAHDSASDVLNWEEAKILKNKGVKYFNWEQDLGIPGLRQSKEKYGPAMRLKKFIVTRTQA